MNPIVRSRETQRELLEVLRACSAESGRLRVVTNPGNAGDALIGAAMWQLFDDLQLSPQVGPASAIAPGDTVLLSGGGNLVPLYEDIAGALQLSLERGARKVILLPHSVRGHDALLRRLDDRFHLFCRDRASFEFCRATAANAQVHLSHDLACFLDTGRLLRQVGFGSRLRLARERGREPGGLRAVLYWHYRLARMRGLRSPQILRADREACADRPASHDIPAAYCSRMDTRLELDTIAADLLRLVARFDAVTTDRLHVGIACALMGTPVTLADNNYGKLRAVYQQSLSHLDHVRLGGGAPPPSGESVLT